MNTTTTTTDADNDKPYLVGWDNGTPLVCVPSLGKTVSVSRLLADGDSNTKTRKNKGQGYLTCGLSMAPHKGAGIGNVCTDASPACIDACLNETGLGAVFPMIQAARIARTLLWYVARDWFLDTLQSEVARWEAKAARKGMLLACRPNVFSDIVWEKFGIVEMFPNVEFYDYSKHPGRGGQLLPNYWVTFSRSEINDDDAIVTLSQGANVAVVFHNEGKFVGRFSGKQRLPKTWRGFPVIDGDTTDLRFDDTRGRSRGRVVGLRLKAPNNNQRNEAIRSGFSVLAK